MSITYFKDKTWSEITRDERYFCFELYQNLKSNLLPFLSLIKHGINHDKLALQDKTKLRFLESIEDKKFDFGIEVCFYRDFMYLYDIKVKDLGFKLPLKRTFDLALFSEDAVIIIEAKAQQGFDSAQMDEFEKDEKYINSLFDKLGKSKPKVYLVGLHSSNYKPKDVTKGNFDSLIKWEDIAKRYPESEKLFKRANDIYRN